MLHDGTTLEDVNFGVTIGRHLIERLFAQIFRRPLQIEEAHAVVETSLLQRPAHAQIADHTLGEGRNPAKRGDLDGRIWFGGHLSVSL